MKKKWRKKKYRTQIMAYEEQKKKKIAEKYTERMNQKGMRYEV